MSVIRDISALDPRMAPLVQRLVDHATAAGIPTYITETRRELATQIAYWLRSRAPVTTVKAVFSRCGLWAITDAEAEQASTQTLYSKHIDGLAADVYPAKNEMPWYGAPADVWQKLWRIAEDECGLLAFGAHEDTKWDPPHVEFREDPSNHSASAVENKRTGT